MNTHPSQPSGRNQAADQLQHPLGATGKGRRDHRPRFNLLGTLLVVALLLGFRAVVPPYVVAGPSMTPTLAGGEYLLVDRTAYLRGAPKRGDVVLFHPPGDDGETYIKRIVGLPGETVAIRDGTLSIDGTRLTEPHLAGAQTTCPRPKARNGCAWIVPAGTIFVLGDNRADSSDSRDFGPVPLDRVVGEAVVTVWPPGVLSPLD